MYRKCLLFFYTCSRYPRHKINQQRVQTYVAQGGNIPEDTPKTGDGWWKKYVCDYNDTSAHMG